MAKSQKNILEDDLYPPMMDYFLKLGYSVELEIPIYKNRIDLFAYNDERTIAVELKLKNWRRALRQASYYQLGADFTYIAMPFYSAIEVFKRKQFLEKGGIGLFGVLLDKFEVRELLKPQLSKKKLEYIENGILSEIKKRR
jgi:hypothetical protein